MIETQNSDLGKDKGRVTRLALAGVLALSMGSAFAFPGAQAQAADASVTIESADPAANEDATYNAYAFFYANVDDQNKASAVTWALSTDDQAKLIAYLGDSYTSWLTESGYTEEGASANPVNVVEYISTSIGASSGSNSPRWVDGGTFASKLAQWTVANLTPIGTATGGQEFTAPEGYYLFVTNSDSLGINEMGTAPIWFPLGGAATTISEKAALPSITKEVQEDSTEEWGGKADAEVGQDLNYRITLTMPDNLNTFDTFYGKVNDTLPSGMTMNTDDVEILVGETNITDSFVLAFADQKFTATCDNLRAIEEVIPGSKIIVNYKAHFTQTPEPVYGGEGNPNTATFEYSNNPNSDSHGSTNPVEAKAYTYKIKVDKLDSADETLHLQGAQFSIRNAENKYLTDEGIWSEEKDDAAKFASDDEGIVTISGLDEGVYVINEVVAPTGYKRYEGDITIEITSEFDDDDMLTLGSTVTGGLEGTELVGTDASAGTIQIAVTNEGVKLAMSGAQGVGLGGAVVVAAGVVWYVARRRRNINENKD